MSTRSFIKIVDDYNTVNFYRHSDGYPEGAGADLKEFVKDYKAGAMRLDAMQSSGWLVVRGHVEYKEAEPSDFPNPQLNRIGKGPDKQDRYSGWKVGAYEPAGAIDVPGDVEYVYTIDLVNCTLTCTRPNGAAVKEFKTVNFKPKGGAR